MYADTVASATAAGASFALPVAPVQISRATGPAPQNTLPYFPGVSRPLIVRSNSTGPDLVDGPAPCGILPTDALADPAIVAARNNAPGNAVLAVVRHETGPIGFEIERTLTITSLPGADTLTLYNLTPAALVGVTVNGATVGVLPFTRQTLFGGAGTVATTTIGTNRAWIVCTPEGPLNVALSAGGVTRTLAIPDAAPDTQTLYLLRTCGEGDVASPGPVAGPDGELTADDVILFITWFTSGDARADVARPGPIAGPDGEFTADDIILFISRFTGGC